MGIFIAGWVVAYAAIVAFFLIERFVRKGPTAKNMTRTKDDRGSTTLVSVAMGVAFVLVPISPLLDYLGWGFFPQVWTVVVGAVLAASGAVIRYFAFSTLGRFFTRTLQRTDGHILVTNGIYRRIRHPGYLSDIMIFVGASLATCNLITLVTVVVLFAVAYSYRIHTEEIMLIHMFGSQYRQYQQTSKRLIPFVF